MKKILLVALGAALLSGPAFAQRKWSERPETHTVNKEWEKESIVLILDERSIKLEWNEKEDRMYQNRSMHRIAKLLDDKGVESFNTLVLGSGKKSRIKEIKARTIKSNGRVIELSSEQMRTDLDERGNLRYHIAFQDVNIGDEVEFYYEEWSPVDPFGSERMQFEVPIAEARFTLIAPAHLSFDCKGYNGFPDAKVSETEDEKTYTAEKMNVAPIRNETYASVDVHSMRLDYKLSYVSDKVGRMYTWNELVRSLNEMLYSFSDKENKAAQKYLDGLKLNAAAPEEETIARLEGAIKKDIIINEALTDDVYERVDHVIEKKTGSEKGVMRLFLACLEILKIKHEPGLSSNRFEHVIDEEFENWNALDIYLIYFHRSDRYIMPTSAFFRFPSLSPAVEGNKAIFCKRVSLASLNSAVAVVREIPISTGDQNWSTINTEITFDEGSFDPNIDYEYNFAGSSALGIRETIALAKKENEKELIMSLTNIVDQEKDISSYSFMNRGMEPGNYAQPVGLKAKFKADKLLERSGDKFLFKVGDVIGPQMQMYKEGERILPITIEFAHSLNREMIIHIPQGYRIVNPEAVNMNVDFGKDEYGFVSTHKIEDNKMTISIREHYAKINYDRSVIENFRKVINAAADFNKVTLVMEKL